MLDEPDIDAMRSKLNKAIARMVGPMALLVYNDLIHQLPNGLHKEGWFLPDHKAIMTKRAKMSTSVYYTLIGKLLDVGLLSRKRKAFGTTRGIWYRIEFDKMLEIVKAE